MRRVWAVGLVAVLAGCSRKPALDQGAAATPAAVETYTVDAGSAGSVSGTIRYTGVKPKAKLIDMSEDPACVAAHQGKAYDESLVVGAKGGVGNAFVYVKRGLEGKKFAVPEGAVTIDQKGCWFRPRVMGVQVGQTFEVVNSDPVTHNIHPMAVENREWNHSQGPGDAPMKRKFTKAEVMIPVKCNIHSWMRAYVGVVDHPYFAVTGEDGSFSIGNLPPGTYTIAVWQEKLGTEERQVTIAAQGKGVADFVLNGK